MNQSTADHVATGHQRGARSAEKQAAIAAAGASVGVLVGMILGFRMYAGEQRVRHRVGTFRDAWIILRS